MKQFYLTVLFLLFFSVSAVHSQIWLIPKAGANVSAYTYKKGGSTSVYQWGISGGIGVSYPHPRISWLSFQTELNYVPKKLLDNGTTIVDSPFQPGGPGNTITSYGERQLHYLEVPVLAKINLGNKKVKGFIHAGPSFGFALTGSYESYFRLDDTEPIQSQGKIRFGKKAETYTGSTIYYDSKEANRIDLGLQLGGGVRMPLGIGALVLEARYGLGLNHFIKEHTKPVLMEDSFTGRPVVYRFTVPASQKSRVFALTCGYAIPFDRK